MLYLITDFLILTHTSGYFMNQFVFTTISAMICSTLLQFILCKASKLEPVEILDMNKIKIIELTKIINRIINQLVQII